MPKKTKSEIEPEFRMPARDKMRIIPKNKRREFPPEAFEDRNTKVKISIYLDLDVLDYFKGRAANDGTPYQTQINGELRALMEREQTHVDPAAHLREAKGLIDAALRKMG